jgi:hypothetical protein
MIWEAVKHGSHPVLDGLDGTDLDLGHMISTPSDIHLGALDLQIWG